MHGHAWPMGVQKRQNCEHTHTIKSNACKHYHTCNTKRSQKTFEPRANKPNHSHTSRNVTHTIRTSHEMSFRLVQMSHTKKSNFHRGGVDKLAC